MHEICPSCGTQFGLHVPGKTAADTEARYEERRRKWIDGGMRYRGPEPPPPDWNPVVQLRNIGIEV